MATRLYFTKDAAAVTPSAWIVAWDVDGVGNRACSDTMPTSGDADNSITSSGVDGQKQAIARFVSPPINAQTISGTIKGVCDCGQDTDINAFPTIGIKVIASDGSHRGTLLEPTVSNVEANLSVGTRVFRNSSGTRDLILTDVTCQANDRIVIEVGITQVGTGVTTCRYNITPGIATILAPMSYRDSTVSGNAAVGWVQFSQSISGLTSVADIVHVNSDSTPADAVAATNTADPTATTITSAEAGDLVLMIGQQRASAATLAISQAGGQTWTTHNAINATNQTARLFSCVFDGTWDADPSVDFSATTCNSVQWHVFRAPANYEWSVNQALAELDFTGTLTPTITGQTTTGGNPTITVAGWFTADDNTWGSISGTGWFNIGGLPAQQQYRNTSGSDQSATYACKPQNAAGATGNVTKTQLTNGDDPGTSFIITFAARLVAVGSASGTGAATGNSHLVASSYGDAASPPLPRLEMLLHANGVDGASGTTAFVDSAGRYAGRFFTSGSPAIDTGQIKFGTSSIEYSGGQDLGFQACPLYERDFTMDFWVRRSSGARVNLLGFDLAGDNWLAVWVNSSDKLTASIGSNSGSEILGTTTFTSNAWHHIALTRSGNSFRLFLNGTQEGSTYTSSVNFGVPDGSLGTWAGADYLTGHIDEFRIVLGHAAWTANFTAPTSEYLDTWPPVVLLLHGDGTDGSTTIIDSATRSQNIFSAINNAQLDTAQSKFGGSSLLLDGTTDYLYPSGINAEDFGFPGDFTIDLWIRFNDITGTQVIWEQRLDAGTPGAINLQKTVTHGIRFLSTDQNLDISSSAGVISATTWYHIAVARSGGDVRLFIDGTVVGSQSSYTAAVPIPPVGLPQIGWEPGVNGNAVNGWIDEFRVLRGRAAWTANFTPPTAPYTGSDLDNCILLLHFDGADASTTIKDDSRTDRHPVAVAGNAQIDTAQSKFGGSSILFDGTDDFLTLDGRADFIFGTGDFTIDFWVRMAALVPGGGGYVLLDFRNGSNIAFAIFIQDDETIQFIDENGTAISGLTALSVDTWYHYAVVRSNGIVRHFLNGSGPSGTSYTNNFSVSATGPKIGERYDGTLDLNGWIDELRIIKGYAAYTGNFTTPTLPHRLQLAEAVGEAITASDSGAGSASGTGAANGTGAATAEATGSASGTGTGSATGASTVEATGSASGTGTATGDAAAFSSADGSASGTGTATATGASTAAADGSASGTGTATGTGASTAASDGSASGTGTANATAEAGSLGAASGTGSASGTGEAITAADGSASGTGAANGAGTAILSSDGSASGTGTADAAGASTAEATGSATGTGATNGIGASTAEATASASGTGDALGISQAGVGTGDADGTGAANGVGASIFSATGAATGAGTASGTGASTVASDGAASGTGAASATGTGEGLGVGSASGTGSASGLTEAGTATGDADGTGTGTATGAAISAATGSAAGTGTGSAVSEGTLASVGLATGIGTGTGTGASTAASSGAGAGTGTASATGLGISPAVGSAAATGAASATGEDAGIAGSASGTGAAQAAGESTAASVGASSGFGATVSVIEILGLRRATKPSDIERLAKYLRPTPAVEGGTYVVDLKRRPETVD